MTIDVLTSKIYEYLKAKNGQFIPVRLPNRLFAVGLPCQVLNIICDEVNADPLMAVVGKTMEPFEGVMLRIIGIGLVQFYFRNEFMIEELPQARTNELDFLDDLIVLDPLP